MELESLHKKHDHSQAGPSLDYTGNSFPGIRASSGSSVAVEVLPGDASSEAFGAEPDIDPELKLPKLSSLTIIICANLFLQISFFIIVSSSNDYAQYLGGDSTFSGIVIGIPTVFSGIALLPLMRYDRGGYKLPLHISCAASIVGHVLYASAYAAGSLYMILVGRIVSGLAFSMWMYCKRYIGDARIVGIRRRTTLATWLVFGQGCGMAAGPFFGGLLYKVGFRNNVFNGYTSPGWIMAGVWAAFWVFVTIYYEDPPANAPDKLELPVVEPLTDAVTLTETIPESLHSRSHPHAGDEIPEAQPNSSSTVPSASSLSPMRAGAASPPPKHRMSASELGVAFAICWCSMTCFFVLGGWESNIPVFASSADAPQFGWSPFASGNFIALGGMAAFPFLIANLFVAPRLQDRVILAGGSGVGLAGLLLFTALLAASRDENDTSILNYGSYLVCWWAIALGFNIASTITMSLLSKQLPPEWNGRTSLAIQYSNYTGRVTGAIWGGSGVKVGMLNWVGLDIAVAGIAGALFMVLWRDLKAKKG